MIEKNKKIIKQSAKGNNIQQIAGDQIIKSSLNIHLFFENAAKLINEGKAQAAQVMLENIWKINNEEMTDQEKSNCWRLIGCSFDRQDKMEDAGRSFLKAKDYDPKWEKARAFEAIGYLCLGNRIKAFELAKNVLNEYSQNTIAWSVWIRCAPKNICFKDIENKLEKHLRDDVEVAIALAERATNEDKLDIAEEYMAKAIKKLPGNPMISEELGDLMLQRSSINDQIIEQREPSLNAKTHLERAEKFYTESLKKWQEEQNITSIARVRRKRAWVYMALLQNKTAIADISYAYELMPDNPPIVYLYAITIGQEKLDDAINALKKIAGTDERLSIEHLLGQMLQRRNQNNDLLDAKNLLKNNINKITNIPEDARFDYITLLLEIEKALSGIELSLETLRNISDDLISKRLRSIIHAQIISKNDKEEATKLVKEISLNIDDKSFFGENRFIANLMMDLGLYKDALIIWKRITRTDCIGQATFKMIDCAKQAGEEKEILNLSVNLRNNNIWNKDIFEYEIYIRQKYNDWRNCKSILLNYIEKPFDENYTPYVRSLLSHVAVVIGDPNLIETDISRLPSPYDVKPGMGFMIVQSLRIGGEPLKAVEFAYELVRNNWNSLEAYTAMANFMIPIGPKQLELSRPYKIDAGVAVLYEELGAGEKKWHIIEDSKYGFIDSSKNEFSIEHPYSKKMRGLKKGDTFLLRGNEIQKRISRILEVISKYHYRINNCIDEMEDKFQDKAPVFKINAYREDGQIDLEPFERLADISHVQGEELLKTYRHNPLSIYYVANRNKKDVFTTLVHLIEEKDIEIQCRLGLASETAVALQAIEKIEEVVIDEMALASILICDKIEFLKVLTKKLIISEGTLINIKNWEIMRIDSDNPGGIVGKRDGKLFIVERSKEGINEAKNKINKLIKFIREDCIIESGIVLQNFDIPNIDDIIEFVGRECTESMALASLNNRIFWTDDFVSSILFTTQFGGQRIWTQCIFEYLMKHSIIDPVIYNELTFKLLTFGYWFTSLTEEIAITAIKKSDWDTDHSPLKDVLSHFGDKRVNLDANLMIMISKLLKYCWDEDQLQLKATAITIRAINELSKRGNETALIKALWIWLQRIFGLDIITLEKIRSVIDDWLKRRGGGTIIIP
jgi:hypothetical protein